MPEKAAMSSLMRAPTLAGHRSLRVVGTQATTGGG
jgi:hypothetical protein